MATFNKKKHLKENIDAISIAFELKKQGRIATKEELNILSNYVGFGALKSVQRPANSEKDISNFSKSDIDLFPYFLNLNNIIKENSETELEYNEYINSLRNSVLTSFYTPKEVANSIVKALKESGIKAYNSLEPSAGNGIFIDSLGEISENIISFEKDKITGLILSAQKSNISKINVTGFEEIKKSQNNYFDLTISNIPFGDFKIYDESFINGDDTHKLASKSIHNYFFVKGVESLRNGGILAFITSQSILNTDSNKPIREWLVSNCDLISAIRLPNNLFSENAGTEVGSDLIILQKNTEKKTLSELEKRFIISQKRPKNNSPWNNYFTNFSHIVSSEWKTSTDPYGKPAMVFFEKGGVSVIAEKINKILSVDLSENINLELYNEFLIDNNNQVEEFTQIEENKEQSGERNLFGEDSEIKTKKTRNLRNTLIKENIPESVDGTIIKYKEQIGILRIKDEKKYLEKIILDERNKEVLEFYISIRETYSQLYNYELYNKVENNSLRFRLNEKYDAFVEKFGYLSASVNKIILEDIRGKEISFIENSNNGIITKSTIFFEPVSFNSIKKENYSVSDALMFSLNKNANIDLDLIVKLVKTKSKEEILVELSDRISYNPLNNGYEIKEKFIAGNVIEKSKLIETYLLQNPNDDLAKNSLQELKDNFPVRIPFEDLDFNFGERWIPVNIYESFASLLFDTTVKIFHEKTGDEFIVDVRHITNEISSKYCVVGQSNRRQNGISLLTHALQNTYPTFNYTITNSFGEEIKLVDGTATQQAAVKINEIRDKFVEWLNSQSKEFKENLANIYNDKFNCIVKPTYNGEHQTFPELNRLTLAEFGIKELYSTQKNVIWMQILNGGGIVDHEVGGGKTLSMCIAAYEMKRLGLIHKPLIIGLKANIEDIAKTFKAAYPHSQILFPTAAEFNKTKREEFFYKLANNNWDCVIMTHEQFKAIPQDKQISLDFMRREIDECQANLDAIKQTSSTPLSSKIYTGLEVRIQNLIIKLKQEENLLEKSKDEVINFKSMGIDHIFVDESHQFKNLKFQTRHNRVPGLGNSAGSVRATNLLLAIRTIQERNGRDLGATFFSGTTISNSLTELFCIFKYLRPRALEKQDIRSFDMWAAIFAQKTTEYELSITNEIVSKERFRKFIKVPELAAFYSEITDYKTAKMIGIDRPNKTEILHAIPCSEQQEEMLEKLKYFAETGDATILDREPLSEKEMKGRMLIATNYSKKMAMDLRMIDSEKYYDEPNNKSSHVAAKIAEYYTKFNEKKGTQFVFSDLSVYDKNKWNIYGDIKRKLIEDYNIPENEIKFIQESTTEKSKEEIISKMNNGDYRVVFGSTQKLGTGVNAQQRAVAIHHVNIPWRPSDFEQRNGRAVRKGNLVAKEFANNNVDVFIYAYERSLDSYKFNLLKTKQQFINQIKNNKVGVRKYDDTMGEDDSLSLNFAEYTAILSGNTALIDKVKVDKKLQQLLSERGNFFKEKESNKYKLSEKINNKERFSEIFNSLSTDLETFNANVSYDEENNIINKIELIGLEGIKDPKLITEHLLKLEKSTLKENELLIGNTLGFELYCKAQTITFSENDNLFSETRNKFFLKGSGKIEYMHNNGFMAKDPKLAIKYFINAITKIPELQKSYEEKISKLDKDISFYENMINSNFTKNDEILKLQRESEELDLEIQSSTQKKQNITNIDDQQLIIETMQKNYKYTIDFAAVKQDLEKVVQSEGYEQTASDIRKSTKQYKRYSKGSDKILLSDVQNGYYQYYRNCDFTGDHGDTVMFLLNRLGGTISTGNTLRGNYEEIAKKLNIAKNYNYEVKKVEYKKEPFRKENFDLQPVKFTKYKILSSRGLNDLTIDNDLKNQILNYKSSFEINGSQREMNNILFPWTDIEGNIKGGQYKYVAKDQTTKKLFLPNSDRENCLWKTNLENKSAIFITEDPIDALSHRKMYPELNYGYVCTGGSVTNAQIELLHNLQTKYSLPLVLGMDNDAAGLKMNTQILNKITENEYTCKDVHELAEYAQKHGISVEISTLKDWNDDLKEMLNAETQHLSISNIEENQISI